VDSRTYRFIYRLATNADIPNEFPKDIRDLRFDTGVFLPQADPASRGRNQMYPARLFLLQDRYLYLVPHPASGEQIIQIHLDDLVQLETGYNLLRGWFKFTPCYGVEEIIYNTRASHALEELLAFLKRRWLWRAPPLRMPGPRVFGDNLDIKFRNMLHFEMDRGEFVLFQYFQAPVRAERKLLFLRRVKPVAGQLVLLTSANRILWITDLYKGYRELYASISRSAPMRR
jgi:hypothetical protein